ncbi:MAG: DNA/pantothenate metabolism flavoprotein domain protein [Verrucomicrobiales bacterium]|nr:DNA/pantothenate metabolism flavoprotein domain protein [Verrucomicrobiales bacterium]
MNCLVTAGPTYEPIDQVRRLTNFSSGQLGTRLAGYLAEQGHQVTLLRGEAAVCTEPPGGVAIETYTTTADLGARLETRRGGEVQAVFHAAAVADFAAGRVFRRDEAGELIEVREGKLATRAGEVLLQLVPTPKIIRRLREWFPKALLVGWKYEVEDGRAGLLARAAAQLRECRTDLCVVNGPAWGTGFGLVDREKVSDAGDDEDLFQLLLNELT